MADYYGRGSFSNRNVELLGGLDEHGPTSYETWNTIGWSMTLAIEVVSMRGLITSPLKFLWGVGSRRAMASKGLSAGAQRVARFGHLWRKASLDSAIARHAGPKATSWVPKTGKTIFENPASGRRVLVDPAGYFRIFQPRSLGSTKGVYLDMAGKVSAPARVVKGGAIKNVPLQGDALQQATHFLIQ